MVLLSLFFLLPLVIMFVGAFKDDFYVLADGDSLRAFVPNPSDGGNFGKANDRAGLFTLFRNSVIVSVVTVAVGLVVNSLMGYALARVPFKMSKVAGV